MDNPWRLVSAINAFIVGQPSGRYDRPDALGNVPENGRPDRRGGEGPLTQIEQVIAALKSQILSGRLEPGLRLMEVRIAEELGVSRTPVRLALSWLEREGLVYTTGPKRGFIVREFDPAEVFGAIEIRGCLEGMAARLSAEIGCTPDMEQRFLRSL